MTASRLKPYPAPAGTLALSTVILAVVAANWLFIGGPRGTLLQFAISVTAVVVALLHVPIGKVKGLIVAFSLLACSAVAAFASSLEAVVSAMTFVSVGASGLAIGILLALIELNRKNGRVISLWTVLVVVAIPAIWGGIVLYSIDVAQLVYASGISYSRDIARVGQEQIRILGVFPLPNLLTYAYSASYLGVTFVLAGYLRGTIPPLMAIAASGGAFFISISLLARGPIGISILAAMATIGCFWKWVRFGWVIAFTSVIVIAAGTIAFAESGVAGALGERYKGVASDARWELIPLGIKTAIGYPFGGGREFLTGGSSYAHNAVVDYALDVGIFPALFLTGFSVWLFGLATVRAVGLLRQAPDHTAVAAVAIMVASILEATIQPYNLVQWFMFTLSCSILYAKSQWIVKRIAPRTTHSNEQEKRA